MRKLWLVLVAIGQLWCGSFACYLLWNNDLILAIWAALSGIVLAMLAVEEIWPALKT